MWDLIGKKEERISSKLYYFKSFAVQQETTEKQEGKEWHDPIFV